MHLVLKEPSFNALHGKAYENHVDLYALENSMPLRDQVIKTLTPYYLHICILPSWLRVSQNVTNTVGITTMMLLGCMANFTLVLVVPFIYSQIVYILVVLFL